MKKNIPAVFLSVICLLFSACSGTGSQNGVTQPLTAPGGFTVPEQYREMLGQSYESLLGGTLREPEDIYKGEPCFTDEKYPGLTLVFETLSTDSQLTPQSRLHKLKGKISLLFPGQEAVPYAALRNAFGKSLACAYAGEGLDDPGYVPEAVVGNYRFSFGVFPDMNDIVVTDFVMTVYF